MKYLMKSRLLTMFLLSLQLTGCGSNNSAGFDATATVVPVLTITEINLPMPTSHIMSIDTIENQSDANVTFVRIVVDDEGGWTFFVTLEHADIGWDDYADGWDVVTQKGDVLKADPNDAFTRVLLHPHVAEQPFTRSQSGITIPFETTSVTVRAHDSVDGFGGQEIIVDLGNDIGAGYKIER